MNPIAQSQGTWRCPRVQLAEITPAILRMPDGSGSRATLKTISLTGGLLDIQTALHNGSRISLLFVTSEGPVRGAVEMLSAVSTNRQPFRFVSLEESSQRRLRTVIESLLPTVDPAWIMKYRVAMTRKSSSPRSAFAFALAAVALVFLCWEVLRAFQLIP